MGLVLIKVLLYRFEKSLYDLIQGLRNHKGTEKEYIQKSLKECRVEVRSQDMGKKMLCVPWYMNGFVQENRLLTKTL